MEKKSEYLNLSFQEFPDYPRHSITWIVPSPAGGDYDERARALAPLVQEFLPRKVDILIQNTDYPEEAIHQVLRAKPDGHTWISMTFPGHITSYILGKADYDLRGFGWLARMSRETRVLSVSAKSSFRSLKDLQQAARVRWPEMAVGSSDFVHDILQTHIMKINFSPIFGFKGLPSKVQAAVRGEVDVLSTTLNSQHKWLQTGELIPVVQHAKTRDHRLPDVPTSGELGYGETTDAIAIDTLVALPPGVPRGEMEIIKAAFYRAVWDKRFFDWIVNYGRVYAPLGPCETEAAMENQLRMLEKYIAVLKEVVASVTKE